MNELSENLILRLITVAKSEFNILYDRIAIAVKTREKITLLYTNAHIITIIKSNTALAEALNSADHIYSDGFGIWLSAKLFRLKEFHRFNWTDHAVLFLSLAAKHGWKIFFIGSTNQVLLRAKNILLEKYPEIKIVGFLDGYDESSKSKAIDIINNSFADILWVGMGSPKQEIWINYNREKLNIPVIQAVGDVFTFLAGEKIRGPILFQKLGIEWFFRLLSNPKRFWKRYLIGIPLFLFRILKIKFHLIIDKKSIHSYENH
ncbi:MAG: WecB/TagA/CpsF family glycosyltransferase [bacterium]